MVKSNRNGQALSMDTGQMDAIMNELSPMHRAVLSTCRCTAARVSEALSLRWENVTSTDVVIPKQVVKKKTKTRQIPMNPRLWDELRKWRELWPVMYKRDPNKNDYLFPNRRDHAKHLTSQSVDYALRNACKRLSIEGASTHSFRRSALTSASSKGVPLRVIQSISGHSSLECQPCGNFLVSVGLVTYLTNRLSIALAS